MLLAGLSTSSWHDRPKPRQDGELLDGVREPAEHHPRRGDRFIHALLVNEGQQINRKRVRSLWRAAGRAIKKKPSQKIRTGNTLPMTADYPNHVWTDDFIFEHTSGGATLNILTLTDEFTRQSLAIRVAEVFTSMDVKTVLDEVIQQRGAPTFVRSDNGSEFIARDLGIRLAMQEVSIRNTLLGKPWQNGVAESFYSRLREECLT